MILARAITLVKLENHLTCENFSFIFSNYLIPPVNFQDIEIAQHQVNTTVLKLPARENTLKFSIVVDGDPRIVTMSENQTTGRKLVSCDSGLCSMGLGNKRLYENLGSAENICGHLKLFRMHLGILQSGEGTEDVAEEDDLANDDDDESRVYKHSLLKSG